MGNKQQGHVGDMPLSFCFESEAKACRRNTFAKNEGLIKMTIKYNVLGKAGLLLIVIFFCFGISLGFAGNIHLGKLRVEPEIGYKLEYNDNVALVNTDEQTDYIHTISPGLLLKYEGSTPGNFISAGYKTDIVVYTDLDENNYEAHKPFFSLGYRSPGGFYLKAIDAYIKTADPYGAGNLYGQGRKTRRWNNTFDFVLGYEFGGKYGIEGSCRNFLLRYEGEEDEWQNRKDHRYSFDIFYKIADKTSVFGEYRYTQGEYDEQNDGVSGWTEATSQDYTLDDYSVGVRFEPGAKLRGEIKIGYGRKNFENEADKSGRQYVNQDSWMAESEVKYTPTDRTELSCKLKRSIEGSPTESSSSYLDTFMGFDIRHSLTRQFSLGAGLDWRRNDYSDENLAGVPKRHFNIYTARAGFEWQFYKYFTGGMDYLYKSRDANDNYYESEEYDNNVFSLRLNAVF